MIHSFDKTCNNDVVSRAFIVPIFQFQLLTPWVTGFFLGWGNPCGVKIVLWISLKFRGLLVSYFLFSPTSAGRYVPIDAESDDVVDFTVPYREGRDPGLICWHPLLLAAPCCPLLTESDDVVDPVPLLLADLESVPIYARRWSTPPQGRWSSWLSQCCCWTVSSGSLAPTYTEMFPLLSVMYRVSQKKRSLVFKGS